MYVQLHFLLLQNVGHAKEDPDNVKITMVVIKNIRHKEFCFTLLTSRTLERAGNET